jgi:hypothetical protein
VATECLGGAPVGGGAAPGGPTTRSFGEALARRGLSSRRRCPGTEIVLDIEGPAQICRRSSRWRSIAMRRSRPPTCASTRTPGIAGAAARGRPHSRRRCSDRGPDAGATGEGHDLASGCLACASASRYWVGRRQPRPSRGMAGAWVCPLPTRPPPPCRFRWRVGGRHRDRRCPMSATQGGDEPIRVLLVDDQTLLRQSSSGCWAGAPRSVRRRNSGGWAGGGGGGRAASL